MTEIKKVYDAVPAGAVFEASQKSIRFLNLKVVDESIASRKIVAKTGWLSVANLLLSFSFSEVGMATELTVTSSTEALTDWGEGKKIINAIFDRIEIEIESMREAGRIAQVPVAPTVFEFGNFSKPAVVGNYNPTMNHAATAGNKSTQSSSPTIKVGDFSLSGRRNRLSYFWFLIRSIIVLIVAAVIIITNLDASNSAAMLVAYVLILSVCITYFTVTAQRCRDFGWTGWSCLIPLLPVVGWIFSLVIIFIPGTVGDNRYGAPQI